ncbi:Fic family protein [Nocardia fluminea]|uniref:Fic family protein n=1 Tax=Nocardia fluminea TaxID=134984 RepID=UPI003672D0C9
MPHSYYQYATIHPYYDGNGWTARLLTTLVLHRAGYGLTGISSLDEHYARNLSDYYAELTVGPSHNYYFGRTEADLTGFLDFCWEGTAALGAVRAHAVDVATRLRVSMRIANTLVRKWIADDFL